MSDHNERLSKIGIFAAPPEGSKARADLDRKVKEDLNNPEFVKWSKDNFNRCRNNLHLQLSNGAGLIVDPEIRWFQQEFTVRNWEHGLRSMPSSFNIMEAFFEYDPKIQFFKLLDEEDHQFSFTDFIDFVTSPNCPSSLKNVGDNFQEDLIYSYNIINELDELTFRTDAESTFVLAGVSIVKRGNEITIFGVCGQKFDYEETKKALEEDDPVKTGKTFKPKIKAHPDLNTEPVLLLNNKQYQKVLAASRFNIETLTTECNYLLIDNNSSFMIITDDPSGMTNEKGEFLTKDLEGVLKSGIEKIDKNKALFEALINCLHLPEYFDLNEDAINQREYPTKLQEEKDKSLFRKDKNFDFNLKIKSRTVWSLERDEMTKSESDSIILMNDEMKIERSGFYKRLEYNQFGKDRNGERMRGKTWVDKVQTWHESTKDNKSLILEKKIPTKKGANPGIIYVMRNASHDKDIFKVGLTTRNSETRAQELSSTTSSVDKFLVANEWHVGDCTLAEKLIHERLKSFRLNDRREFFKIDYLKLMKIIVEVIGELEGASR